MTIKTGNDREAAFLMDLCSVLEKYGVELMVEDDDNSPYSREVYLTAFAFTEYAAAGYINHEAISLNLGSSVDASDKPKGDKSDDCKSN